MSVKIIIDSTTDLPAGIQDKVSIVPLTIRFGQEEFIDGVTITSQKFYEMLVESDDLPTTSQPTPFAFSEAFREAVADGSQVVAITVSEKLSGTYQSASIAAADFPGQVYVVDSRTVAIGAGILTQYALTLAEQGAQASAIAEALTQIRDKVQLIAMLDTLEYLKKGGRISAAVAFAGGVLNIKPVICIKNGEIKMLGKARGSKQGNNLLVQEIGKAGGVDFTKPVLLGYTGLSDALLQKYIVDSAALWEGHLDTLPCTIVGSTVGTHAGPGGVAVAFFSLA